MEYIKFILIGGFLFLIFRIVPRIFHKLNLRKSRSDTFTKYFPILEFIIWTGFLFWAVREIFEDKFYFTTIVTGIVIIILIIIAFFVFKDFAAGLVLKTEYGLKKDEIIEIENSSGKIIKLGYLSLELETSKQEKVKIPYGKISGKKITIPNPSESLKRFLFNIRVAKKKDLLQTKQELKKKLLNAPWTAVTKLPEIQMKKET